MKVKIHYAVTINMKKEIEIDDKFNKILRNNNGTLKLKEELYNIAEANCPKNGEVYGVSCNDGKYWLI